MNNKTKHVSKNIPKYLYNQNPVCLTVCCHHVAKIITTENSDSNLLYLLVLLAPRKKTARGQGRFSPNTGGFRYIFRTNIPNRLSPRPQYLLQSLAFRRITVPRPDDEDAAGHDTFDSPLDKFREDLGW